MAQTMLSARERSRWRAVIGLPSLVVAAVGTTPPVKHALGVSEDIRDSLKVVFGASLAGVVVAYAVLRPANKTFGLRPGPSRKHPTKEVLVHVETHAVCVRG
jgi:hypothetical protein